MNSKPFLKNGMGAEQHTRMYASGSSGHGGPGEREAPMPFFKKVYSLKGKLQIGWMTGFAFHGSPIQVELVPGRLLRALAHPCARSFSLNAN